MEVENGAGSVDPKAGGEGQADKVSYESHRKLLEQHKKAQDLLRQSQEKLEQIAKEKQTEAEKKLVEQGEFQKLLALREEEIAKLRVETNDKESKLSDMEKTMLNAKKLSAFQEKLPGKIKKSEYYTFVNLEDIPIDPATGKVDEIGLDKTVKGFIDNYKDLIDHGQGVKLPQGAAAGFSKLTYDEWLKLPLKEKKARQGDVVL